VWEDVKLPDGKILIPGVVSHATNVIEHPELVADRIGRFARLVGREAGVGEAAVARPGAELATKQLWR
jgi:5-methyltetrahydropteroyltriglutamate--homocysteine methyltransferase